MKKLPIIVGVGAVTAFAAFVYAYEYSKIDFAKKADALRKSAEWYVPDVNVQETEALFIKSLEDLTIDPSIDTAQRAQRASMLNLFAICGEDTLDINSALDEFQERADAYLELLDSLEGHDEYAAHYRSRVEWRKDLATVVSEFGLGSWEYFFFIDTSTKIAESEQHKKKMAELDKVWEVKYKTPQRDLDKERFIARRDIFLENL